MPCPLGLVEKNGVKSFVAVSLSIPLPSSDISRDKGLEDVRNVIFRFSPIDSAEFLTMFISTCSNNTLSSITSGIVSSVYILILIFLPEHIFSIKGRLERITLFKDSGFNCGSGIRTTSAKLVITCSFSSSVQSKLEELRTHRSYLPFLKMLTPEYPT